MGLGMIGDGVPLLKYVILSAMGMAVTISSTIFSIQMLAVVQTANPREFSWKSSCMYYDSYYVCPANGAVNLWRIV